MDPISVPLPPLPHRADTHPSALFARFYPAEVYPRVTSRLCEPALAQPAVSRSRSSAIDQPALYVTLSSGLALRSSYRRTSARGIISVQLWAHRRCTTVRARRYEPTLSVAGRGGKGEGSERAERRRRRRGGRRDVVEEGHRRRRWLPLLPSGFPGSCRGRLQSW